MCLCAYLMHPLTWVLNSEVWEGKWATGKKRGVDGRFGRGDAQKISNGSQWQRVNLSIDSIARLKEPYPWHSISNKPSRKVRSTRRLHYNTLYQTDKQLVFTVQVPLGLVESISQHLWL